MQILATLCAVILTVLCWRPLRKLSPGSVLLATPPLEEGAKTLAAWSFAVPIFQVHLGFGLAEAFFELSRRKWAASLAALLTHTIFGLGAICAFSRGYLASLAASLVLHFFWNFFIYRLQLKRGI